MPEYPKPRSVVIGEITLPTGDVAQQRLVESFSERQVTDFMPQYLDPEKDGMNFAFIVGIRGVIGACRGCFIEWYLDEYRKDPSVLKSGQDEWLFGEFETVAKEHREDKEQVGLEARLHKTETELPAIEKLGAFGQWLHAAGFDLEFGKEILKDYWRN